MTDLLLCTVVSFMAYSYQPFLLMLSPTHPLLFFYLNFICNEMKMQSCMFNNTNSIPVSSTLVNACIINFLSSKRLDR